MSLVVPKEKEFPIETIERKTFVLLGRHNRPVHLELLYSFNDAKCLGVGWAIALKSSWLIIGHWSLSKCPIKRQVDDAS